jgi:hypothetical protein
MSTPRRVFLNPDGTLPSLFGVIIEYPTGVRYEHQCAGTECALRETEGYFVPLGGLRFDPEHGVIDPQQLTELFHERNGCVWGGQPWNLPPNTPMLPPERLDRLKALVESIPYWSSDEAGSEQRTHLRLDETRLGELLEAWVPVVTPDGPGVLVWDNCD